MEPKKRRLSSSGLGSTNSSRNSSINSGTTSFAVDPTNPTPDDLSNLTVHSNTSTDNRNQSGSGTSTSDSKSKFHNVPKYKAKIALAKPFLGYEIDELKPIVRTAVLDLDNRFFPTGIQPGSIIELKGEEGAGKTLFITYLLARVVLSSPTNTAVLIDTCHHFNNRVLINMISQFDADITFDNKNYSIELEDVMKANPKLYSYLKRISTIKCLKAEQLLVTLGPGNDSTLEKMLLTDPNLSLVAVDAIDNYSFMSSFKYASEDQYPNFLHLISHAVEGTKTPVICATLMSPYSSSSSLYKNTSDLPENKRFGPQLTSETLTFGSDKYLNSETESGVMPNIQTNQTVADSPSKPDWYSNVVIDYNIFTHSLYLQKLESSDSDKQQKHLRIAHLRSRQSPKTALFSVVNHRAKFSIFSDMLFVDVDG